MDNQAFLSGNDYDDDKFAALDSMVPNSYGQQQPQSNALVPHSVYNTPSSFGSNDSGRMGDGREQGFSGVSGSLFDRIRARTEEQQKQQASQPTSAQQPFQQHPSEPTMELEKDPNTSQTKNAFDTAVAGAASGASTQPNPSETRYSFSGPSDFSSALPPSIPDYGRTARYVSADQNQVPYPSSIQDKASMAFNTLWSGAQTFVASAQEKMGRGGNNEGGGGYNTNFLLREDGLEGGGGAGPVSVSGGGGQSANQAESGALTGVSGQAYSMFSYGKMFCEDMYAFFMQLPNWGKGVVFVVLILLIKFLFI